MNILISNDDGVESPGLHALAEALKAVGTVTVVAPQRERSTTSHTLTLHKPLRCGETHLGYYWVSGSPADCVYIATRHIMKKKPDLIVSGINRGANLGNDTHYSGTVAAAREGAYFNMRSIAISLVIPHGTHRNEIHWETAADFARHLVKTSAGEKIPEGVILNVNVPNRLKKDLKGVKVANQGRRYYSDQVLERLDPRGRPYYWLGGEYTGFENIKDSDCVAVEQGYIAVTPLRTDCTEEKLLGEMHKWEIFDFGS